LPIPPKPTVQGDDVTYPIPYKRPDKPAAYLRAQDIVVDTLRKTNVHEPILVPETHDVVVSYVDFIKMGSPDKVCFFNCRKDIDVPQGSLYIMPKKAATDYV
jgi:hypothetical protein